MAKIAHLILTHQSPEALARLIKAIAHEDADTYIHVDQKVSIDPFQKALTSCNNVFFVKKRIKVNWGGYSMVQATLNTIQEIMVQGKKYDHINFLSGSDYPLKPAEEIHSFFDNHKEQSFVEMHLSDTVWLKEAHYKVRRYYFVDLPNFPGKYRMECLVNAITPKRKLPFNMLLTGRSQWMTLAGTHVQYILDYAIKYPSAIKFFEYTWGPDEFFFQTILYNSEHQSHLVNDNLRFIDWSEGRASPKTFTVDDFDNLEGSGKLYARKFNAAVDENILDQVDHQLLGMHRKV